MNNIKLLLEIDGPVPEFNILLDNVPVDLKVSNNKNQYGHICIECLGIIDTSSILNLIVTNNTSVVSLVEILVDNIRFGLITFLCTTINGQQQTQLNSDGQLDIELSAPIWNFWCEKMNSFNYEDYPLGSIN